MPRCVTLLISAPAPRAGPGSEMAPPPGSRATRGFRRRRASRLARQIRDAVGYYSETRQAGEMKHTSVDIYLVIDTFRLLLIAIGPKIR